MGVQVKVCGLNSLEAAEAAARARADFAGLMFFPPSPRHVTSDQARGLAARLRGGPRIVAVLVDPDDATLAEAIAASSPDFIQLHGKETPERVHHIAATFGRKIIKALPVADAGDLARAHAYEDAAEYLLFDAKAPELSTRPGGHGAAFDWKILSPASFKRPWFLAGGLSADNVARAIRVSGAELVDTSSGVEDALGRKNSEKIAAFIDAARNAALSVTP